MSSAFRFLGPGACLALAIAGCSGGSKPPLARGPDGGPAPPAISSAPISLDKVLNVYNWTDFIDPSVVAAFQNEYGIKVNYDVYDSNEQLETKLLVGHSNYDIVVPSGTFLERQIKAGIYLKLDKGRLPNLKGVDPEAMRGLAVYDPGNQYAVDYFWLTTTGIGYDVAKIKARMADAPVDSWRMLYDPAVLSKFQDCGVSVLDTPDDVYHHGADSFSARIPTASHRRIWKPPNGCCCQYGRTCASWIPRATTMRWPMASSAWLWAGPAT